MIDTLKTFTALSEEFVELFMQHHPVAATEAGIHDYDHVLPDDSPAGLDARAAWLRDLEQRLAASVPWDELPLDARVDFALLRSRLAVLRADLEEIPAARRNPAVYLGRAFAAVQSVLGRTYAPLDERKEAAVARLMAIPDYLDGVRPHFGAVPIELLEAGIEMSARGPAFVDDVVRRLLRTFPGEAERLEHAGSRARTGFLRLHDHLDREARATATGSFALTERWLNHRLEREHLLAWNAADVEVLAREAIARERGRLEDEAKRVDRRRTWHELVDEARERVPEANWLREAYTAEIERARRFVTERRLVPLPAGEKLELGETPLFDRVAFPVAAYQGPAPFDPDHPGQFLVTPVDVRRDKAEQARQLEGHCSAAIPLTVLRASYPGEHVRQVYAVRAATRLRRVVRNDVFAGGWALYAGDVMADAGFFSTDPAGALVQRLDALRAACLALVDAGLHAGRLQPDEAAARLAEEARLDPAQARREVRACCVSPLRGVAAIAGRAAILDLRDEARRRLGDRFDAGAFHAGLLAGGTIPLALVREELWERPGLA